jgi:hypothetical protein
LKSLDPKNEEFLNIIENSLMAAVLDDNEPLTQEEVIYFSFYCFESDVKNKNK